MLMLRNFCKLLLAAEAATAFCNFYNLQKTSAFENFLGYQISILQVQTVLSKSVISAFSKQHSIWILLKYETSQKLKHHNHFSYSRTLL